MTSYLCLLTDKSLTYLSGVVFKPVVECCDAEDGEGDGGAE